MQIYPEKYDQLELVPEEKSFLRTIDRALATRELAYYVLKINPRKKQIAGDSNPELFNLLVINEGILLFRHIKAQTKEVALLIIKSLGNPYVYLPLENDIKCRLEASRYLTTQEGELKYCLNICFVLSDIDYSDVETALSENEKAFCRQHVVFKNTLYDIRKNGIDELVKFLKPFNLVEENVVNNIFQRLCPEITIPRKFILAENSKIEGKDGALSEIDRSVKSYRLDNGQINIVNRIAKGNQLILACAGSGKSVLLISKCFKLAGLNPAESFLITCFNRNLFNYYQWAIAQAGFTERNVKCATFYSLCIDLLEKNKISVPSVAGGDMEQSYAKIFEAANSALAEGRIKDRFYGIFIDEVQIFKPEWYRFCFNLLKSKNADDHYFVIAGDKSQDIKNNIKHGKAPWQGGGADYPEYRGKTLPIEINYRNSKPINEAIDQFVQCAKAKGSSFNVDLSSDPELFLRGTAYREGHKPRLIELQDYSNEGEAKAICDEVKRLINEEGLSEVDIAIILYNKSTKLTSPGWETKYYYLLPAIKRYFFRENWEYPAILIYGESNGETYGSRRGVTIATIEGSLGLDFRAVVLAGLRPLGIHENIRCEADFKTELVEEKLEEKKEGFKKNVNFLYTGCTRAKDELSIVLSEKPGKSIYIDLLRQAMGEQHD